MLLEVIATTVGDAIAAEKAGADRLELVTGMKEGGLTPSAGLIEGTVRNVKIPSAVMVRPHSKSFVYDEDDVRAMRRDIRLIREAGAAGIVIGTLTPQNEVDVQVLEALLEEAGGMEVVFHRAFDAVPDQIAAFRLLSGYKQITRILTSGGKPSALDAVDRMKELVELSRDSHITILAGSGLNAESLESFVKDTGVTEVHFGGAVRGPKGVEDDIAADKIREIRDILARC
ncbi:copper homeostasis protein CutC [Paenibacillus sp. UNC499MF]|uniref:copper homeostasis protein CutC n=1 Tax=Paenibacillus sp. UNC499MF TaxID=1502751 RepID=UPI00089FAB04|nr:copper homeostasis protein CutC [Paenibacillus sp. UNC499MF]SEG78407.1 copper homeostasis protein [Paenibacillus sp. UNC499MF]